MKPIRFLLGIVGFCVSWTVVAITVGLGMVWFFPFAGKQLLAGIPFDWRHLPGTVVGLFPAIQVFRASIRVVRR